ncbi:hypothetical protein EB001_15215 [bacterium]|nr:hypothetical protein [bacterium]
MAVSPYFDLFPKISYDINGNGLHTESVTNIFRRMGILRQVLSNAGSYVLYEIEENDTPEILAEKVYNDAGAGWIILYANKIIDPQFDWPMSDSVFRSYIIEKYGSVDNAQTTYHHYEKIVETTVDDMTYTRRYSVGEERLTENALNVPYTYYTPYTDNLILTADTLLVTADNVSFTVDHSNHASYDDTSLPEYYSYEAQDINGKTVYINTYGNAVTNYDYEVAQNEAKRFIKVIKAQYYTQIMKEFKTAMGTTPSYIRTF